VENGDIAPARISDENYEEVCKLAESALIALGVKNSLSHIELKIGTKGCKLIEVASRMGGDDIYENVKHVWAEDLVKIGLQVACGVHVTHKKRDPKGCVICRYFIPSSSGIITNISGIQEVKKRRNVLEISLSKHVGDAVLVPPEGFDNMGWVITKGRTYQEAQSQMDWVFNNLEINVTRFSKGSSLGKTIRKDSLSSASLVRSQIMRAAKLGGIKVLDVNTLKRLHLGIIYNSSLPYDNNSMKARDIGEDIHRILLSRGYRVSLFDMNESPIPIHKLETAGLDFVLNLCEALHNSTHLESHAAALLDVLQLPYSGSGPATMSLCVDKISIKKLFHFHEIPTPAWDYVYSMEDDIRTDLQYPLIVKPANTDNSFGITNESVVTNREDLMRQIAQVVEGYRRPALIEEYVEGDEYDVCLLGNDDDVRVLPLIRSIFDRMPRGYWHIYGTESKSEEDGSVYNKIRIEKPAKIGEKLAQLLTEISLDVFNLVNCRDYAKVEIRVDKTGNPYVLEVNPNPPIGRDYFFSWSSKLDGLDYEEMIEELLFTAVQRYRSSRLYFDMLEDD
jgi:D-alanine-D-alanine ligase